MGNALAIASVTASLRAILDYVLNGNEALATSLGGQVAVTSVAPQLAEETDARASLNIYLFQVTPNTSLRNAGTTYRGDAPSSLNRPPMAMDLRYLISSYAADPYLAEILLGFALSALHETPVLSRTLMRSALAQATGDDTPAILKAFTNAQTSNQLEQLKITPLSLTLPEITQLWTALRARYVPSIAYMVSSVIL